MIELALKDKPNNAQSWPELLADVAEMLKEDNVVIEVIRCPLGVKVWATKMVEYDRASRYLEGGKAA